MIIEWLKFRMEPSQREAFIQIDNRVWTETLAHYPGFLGKEVWIDPHHLENVIFILRWETREQWKAIPQGVLDRTEEEMQQALGDGYEMVESGEYQVRKFPRLES
jgi:uncharacterized protein (TIGR03792 family)